MNDATALSAEAPLAIPSSEPEPLSTGGVLIDCSHPCPPHPLVGEGNQGE